MSRRFSLPLLLALGLLLAGCMSQYEGQSVLLAEHKDPFAFRETTAAPTRSIETLPVATDYYSLREALMQMILAGVEHGEVRLPSYDGSPEAALARIRDYFLRQDAISAYAIDYLDLDCQRFGSGWQVKLDAIYRRSASEIAAIESVLGSEAALQRMISALIAQENAFTLRVSGYAEEDFAAALRSYVFQHPDQIAEAPEITADVYPDSGSVRVVEVHYVYQSSHENLRRRRTEANAVLDSACAYFRYAGQPTQTVRLMYNYLSSRFRYSEQPDASVYSLLCEGRSSSFTMASVVSWLCSRAGIDCYPVEGLRNGEPWYWNIVELEDGYRHVDFQTQVLAETPAEAVRFRTDQGMKGYEWDREQVPACVRSDKGEK